MYNTIFAAKTLMLHDFYFPLDFLYLLEIGPYFKIFAR